MQRVWGLFLKNFYLIKSSLPRQTQIFFWPMIDLFIWGFLAMFLGNSTHWGEQTVAIILTATALASLFFNIQVGMCMPYMEELWGRTLGHIMVSPVRSIELVIGFILVGLFRCILGLGLALGVAYFLFHYSIFINGIYLVYYFTPLVIFAAGLGLIIASMLTRYGVGADFLVFALAALLAPLSGVVYPIDVLPSLLQKFSAILPTMYVFAGMREALLTGVFNWDMFYTSLYLALTYLVLGFGIFCYALHAARKAGRVLSIGAE